MRNQLGCGSSESRVEAGHHSIFPSPDGHACDIWCCESSGIRTTDECEIWEAIATNLILGNSTIAGFLNPFSENLRQMDLSMIHLDTDHTWMEMTIFEALDQEPWTTLTSYWVTLLAESEA